MKEKGTPYGEARRLRYFVLMSCELLKNPSIDIDLFIDKFLNITEKINPELKNYIRNTGRINSRRVAKNYIEFANWIGFIKVEGRIIIPNSYTVLLSNLDGRWDFCLTEREKIAFFLKMTEIDDFQCLIKTLKIHNSVKKSIEILGKSEHLIESYFEWLVDLGLLKPLRPVFGRYYLSPLGYQILEAYKEEQNVCKKFAELILNTNISENLEISDNDFWNSVKISIDKLYFTIRSEVDPYLYSAYPLILYLQIQFIFNNKCFISSMGLIKKLNAIATNYDAIFNWDNLSKSGYLKIKRNVDDN